MKSAIATKVVSGFKSVKILVVLAACLNVNSYAQQKLNTDSLFNCLNGTVNTYDKVLLLNSIAGHLNSTKSDTAIKLCYEGLRLSEKTGNDSLTAVCYKCLINAYYQKAHFEDSAFYFITLFKKQVEGRNFFKLEYDCYLSIAEVYLKLHNWPQSTVYFQQTMQMAEKTKDPDAIGYAKYKLADMYRKSGSCPDAIPINLELIDYGTKNELPVYAYYGYRGIAICYDIKLEYDSAEKYFTLAVDYARQTKSQKRIATALLNVGVVTWHLKKYNQSITASLKAVEILKELNDEQVIPAYQNLCCVYRDMNILDSAEYYCKLGLDEATKRNQVFSVSILNGITSDVYLKKGDYKTAWEYAEKNRYFNDSLSSLERIKSVKELEEKYKNTEKQAKIDLLKKEQELNAAKLKEQEAKILNERLLNNQQRSDLLIKDLQLSKQNTEINIQKLQVKNASDSLNAVKQKSTAAIELLNLQKKNKERERNFILTGALLIVSVMIVSFVLFRQRQRIKILQEQEKLKLQVMVETQEDERKRIGRDLHDDVGAQLSTLKLFLNSLKDKEGDDRNKLHSESMNVLNASLSDIRNILINLSPKSLDEHGYVVAVEELVNRINKSSLLKFELSIHGFEKRLEPKLENALYRITQELINNTLKYAKAKKIILDVLKSENKITLMYEDDGIGCDLEKARNGYGLTNIKTRAQMFNGTAHFDTSSGNGFRCEVTMSC